MLEGVDPREVSMVRVLIVLAIAIPIVIEVVTFGGLVGHYVGDGGSADPAATATPDVTGAGVGDEILTATGPTERITAGTVTAGDDSWQFVLTANVTDVREPYELRLGTVTTRDGSTVEGSGATTGTLAAGGSGIVTGAWALPTAERPDTLTVTAVRTPENGTASAREYTVAIGDIPVSN